MLNSRLPVRALASTALVGAMTAATGALTAAPVAHADSTMAWTGGAWHSCKVTGTGLRHPVYEHWTMWALLDDNGMPRPAGSMHESRYVEGLTSGPAAGQLRRLHAKTVRGVASLTLKVGAKVIPVGNRPIPKTPVDSKGRTYLDFDGRFPRYRVASKPGFVGVYFHTLKLSLVTDKGARINATCSVSRGEEPSFGGYKVVPAPTTSVATKPRAALN